MLQSIEQQIEPSSWSGGEGMALLAAGAAHELNNPLSVIVGYLSLILSGKTSPERIPEQLLKVQAEAKHCRLVLEGLAQLAGCNEGDLVAVDLAGLLQETLEEATPLSVLVTGERRLPLRGREHGLLLLLRHLLANARESGARSLTITTSRVGERWRLQFQDDGQGLSASARARAKEPFFSTKPGRLGLGLTIGELVVAAHAGSLELLAAPGGGTIAVVSLPRGANPLEPE
jgi:two-component system, NtrC family, sensor kinase